MAGIGSAWGSREEMLHPRDRHGRFRKKWKMAASVVDALSGFLDRFSPRTFQSDQQASQYAFNHKKSSWTTPELQRLHTDWDDANESLQAGEMDPTTKRFVDMMDRNMVETSDDLIVSQTVPVEAFGLSPQQAAMEDGGLEDLIGLEIGDAGYGAFNLGTELSHPPGSATIRVALPKGTRVAYGGRSPGDRSLFTDRDQPLVVTKVEPDGRGGYYILAIAGSGKKTQGATAVADDRTHGRRGGGLTPEQREARVTPQMSGEERLRIAQQNEREMQTGPSAVKPAPGATVTPTPTPAPAAPASPQTPPPAGVPDRQEPVLKDSVGPGSPEGKSASDIATDAEVAKVQAENAPPAPPEPATPESFRVALATTDLKAPSRGKRQKEFDAARVGIVSGKQHPQDALRQLETDIEVNKRQLERQKAGTEKPDPELEQDIKDQEALADLISTHHNIPRRGQEANAPSAPEAPSAPAKKVAKKAGPTPTPGAPSTKKESVPSAAVQEQRGLDKMTKPELLAEAGEAGRARMTKAQLIQAIEAKRAKGEAPPAPAPAKKVPGSKFTPDQERALVERAKKFRGNEKNDEQRRVVGEADAILARREGKTPAKKTVAKAVPEAPAAPAKVAKKAAPAKAAPEPDAAEEAFRARVAEAGLPDKVADLRAMAKDQKIRGFSTMNKKQLQSALLGDEVPKAGKIAPVSPQKLVPHLEAVESDQAARKLLENHTLADLKELAKSRDIEIPKRGATKDRLKDAILADVRGVPEGGLRQEVKESLTDEIKATGLDISGDDANSTGLRRILGEVDDQDPEDLRLYRDRLEKLAASTRELGDRQGADIFQDVADMMGMRAQRISGVEEPALPVKRVAKKAVPEVAPDVPEVPKTLDKMLKPELEEVARTEGVPGVRKSMTKAQLKDAIERNRRLGSGRGGGTDEDRLRRELGGLPGGPERDLGPTAGPLRLPDRAPTAEEIARDNPDLDVQKLFNDAGIPTNDPGGLVGDTKLTLKQEGPKVAAKRLRTEADRMVERIPEARVQSQRKTNPTPADADKAEADVRANAEKIREVADKIEAAPPVKKATKKAAKKAEADVQRAAEALAPQLKGTFGDQIKATDPDEMRDSVRAVGLEPKGKTSEEMFDNALKDMLESRMRELGMLPEDPKKPTRAQKRVPKGSVAGPKADVPIETPGRRDSFLEAYNSRGFPAPGAAGRSLDEVRDDIASGKITPEEGVRRIESDIAFNQDDLNDIEAELRAVPTPGGTAAERSATRERIIELQRRRSELNDSIKTQRQASSFVRDHFKDEAPVTREELEVKLDGPEKAALDRVDVDSLKEAARQEGLGDIEGDDKDTVIQNIAKAVAERELKDRAAKKAAPAKKAPAKKVTKKAAQAALDEEAASGIALLARGGNNEPLIEGAPSRKAAKAAGTVDVPGLLERLNNNDNPMSREDAGALVADLDRTQLQEMAKSLGIPAGSRRTIPDTRRSIVDATVGRRLDSIATRGFRGDRPGAPEPDLPEGAPARQLVESHEVTRTPLRLPPKPVVDLDNPTRHDAELIGTGLDLDPKGEDRQWLDVVQRSLDRGEDGRQIADGLRREADSQRTLHNITESVGGTEGASPAARINRMELMADRLEGVRPIKKAEPPKKSAADEVRSFGTMQAANAASKARSDLRSGKSHAEVATALRTAATGVGSRDHDPHMTSRVGDPTPSEKSAMKRRDAKMLRDLAAEIQAEGVSQRAAAKAAKKAVPAKAPAKKATVNPNLSSLSDDELRKIIASDQFPQSQKDKVQGELDARARRDLTGVTGELIKAQLDDAMRRLQAADNPRLEDDALAGLLAPELKQLAERLGLDTKGSKSTLLQRIKDRVKGREAPGASAERAVPKSEAPGGMTTQPPKPHEWGNLQGQKPGGHYFHPDGEIPMAMDRLGADAQIDVGGGESLHNAMGDIATDLVMGRITGDAAVARLRSLATKLQAGSGARSMVARLAEDLDRPAVAMPKLPDDVPAPARRLVQDLMKFPIARATGHFGGSTYETSLIDKVTKFLREKASGESSLVGIAQDLNRMINNHTHESQEGSMGIQQLVRPLFDDSSDIAKALLQWAKEIRARRRTT